MKMNFKPFTISLMGSMPRSEQLLQAKKKLELEQITKSEFEAILDHDTEEIVRLQEEAGVDIITSGEIDRDNYISFVADHVPGIKIMSNQEIIDLMLAQQREGFEESLIERDADTANINNPICYDRIDTNASFELASMERLRKFTDFPLKATMPSPYLLTRSTWLTGVSDLVYESREELGKDIVQLILNEVKRLIDYGVSVIQLDDPILAEIVLADDEDESFY